jgi:uncharacterized membrane protein
MEERQEKDRQPSGDKMPEAGKAEKYDQKKDIEENKVLAALSYLGILVLVPILAGKDSKFVKFHAKQGLVLFIVDVIASFFVWIAVIGWLLGLGLVIISLYGFVQALQGRHWRLPYLADYAEKLNI